MKETYLVKHTIVHTLNYLAIELMRRAYQLAMMDELKSLDGLVDTRIDKWMHGDSEELIVIDDDLELLTSLDDPGVKIVVGSINTILENNRTFQIIQNIDLEDALMDTEASSEAAGVLSTYILELVRADSYENILSDLETCYTSAAIIIHHCIMQLELGTTEVWEEGMNSWTSWVSNEGSDREPKDSTEMLLLELEKELMKDAIQLTSGDFRKRP